MPTRNPAPITLLALLAAGLLPPGAPPDAWATEPLLAADPDRDPIVEQVTQMLRERDGAEPEPAEVIGALNARVADLYGDGKYREAAELAASALARAEALLGDEHPDTLISVNNLAALYRAQGRYGEAEPLLRRALAARERVLGDAHPQTLTSVNNLAALYYAQGRYGEAEPLYRRALAAHERVLGEAHPQTLTSVNNLAGLYDAQGRYGEAEPLLRRALAARERVLGEPHPDTLTSVNNLAGLYYAQGRYGEAEPLLRRALAARERVLSDEHPQTLTSVNNLAALYQAQGRYGEAEPLLRRALAASERVLGEAHPDTLRSANNLAFLYQAQGRYGEAEPLYLRALAARERVLGEHHANTIASQLNLVVLLVNRQRLDTALGQLRMLDQRMRAFVAQELTHTRQEQVKLRRLAKESRLQDIVFTLALAHPDEADAQRLAADLLLRWKRLAADEEAVIARLARTSQDPRVVELARAIRDSRARLSRLEHLPPAGTDAEQAAARTAEHDRLGALEVDLAKLSSGFRGQQARRGAEWEAVQAALPRGAALLELRAYNPVDFQTGDFGAARWLAMLLAAEPGAESGAAADAARLPRFWDLGPVDDSGARLAALRALEAEIAALQARAATGRARTHAGAGAELARLRAERHTAAAALYDQLFGAMDAEIAGLNTLFLAPDGLLDLVAFARLAVPGTGAGGGAGGGELDEAAVRPYWIQRQSLRQVRVGRDLLPMPVDREQPAAGMLILGGIDYERFPAADDGDDSGGASPGEGPDATPGNIPDELPGLLLVMNQRLRAQHGRFKALEHSGPEAQEVGNHFWDYDNRRPEILLGPAAGEARLKALERPPRLLHLATHGFFLPPPEAAPDAGPAGLAARRALTLAGLALAGANLGLAGELGADGEDGILYALEAQDLNLEGTELVALSACDTGQGRIDVSEGVYGLVRAFQIAGSRHVLMTQWSLKDPLARDFMVSFYDRWLSPETAEDPAAALRAIQLEWLRSGDAARADPRLWAPYVLIERG